jgi:hypothetical protein
MRNVLSSTNGLIKMLCAFTSVELVLVIPVLSKVQAICRVNKHSFYCKRSTSTWPLVLGHCLLALCLFFLICSGGLHR